MVLIARGLKSSPTQFFGHCGLRRETPAIVCLDDETPTEQSQRLDSLFAAALLQNPQRPSSLWQRGLAVTETQNGTCARLWERVRLWSVGHMGPAHVYIRRCGESHTQRHVPSTYPPYLPLVVYISSVLGVTYPERSFNISD